MRPRKRDHHLPACVYLRHGAYWLVKRGKWTRLGSDLSTALAEYARHQAHEQGSMPAIIDQALPAILKGKAPATVAQYTIAARKLQDILIEFAPHQVTQRDEGVYVEQQKTKMRVLIAWNPELSAAVERAKSMHKSVASLYLLPGANGEAPKYGTVWTWWKKACAKAGIEDANIHDLRAMSGTEAEQQGLDPQKLLGHKDASMTRRYLRDRGVKVVHGPSIGQSKKKRATSQ